MYDSLSRANRLLYLKKSHQDPSKWKKKLGVQIDLEWEDTLFNWDKLETHIMMLKQQKEVC